MHKELRKFNSLDLIIHIDISDIFTGILMVSLLYLHKFHILPLKSVIPNFVVCLVFLRIAFSFREINFLFRHNAAMREAAIFEKLLSRYNHLAGR